MGNRKTPLIQKLRAKSGTLYVFPSANEDIGLNLNNEVNGVALSHYALLNIPQLTADQLAVNSAGSIPASASNAEMLAMSLQNYAMNFETLLVNQDSYSYKEMKTVSEKVFWHWMKAIGVLSADNISRSTFGNNYYYEGSTYAESRLDITDTSIHSKSIHDNYLVQCFGAIDAGNSLSTEFGMFNETYINIPTSYGGGPVFFSASPDINFKYKKYRLSSTTALEGRQNDNVQSAYLPYNRPFMDELGFYNTSGGENDLEGLEIVKDLNVIQKILQSEFSNDDIVVSSYDDLNVDINNRFDVDTEFDFNAILLYYSIYDKNDLVKTSYATNLFGIIFIDGPVRSTDAETFYIPPYTKIKSNAAEFGNSFSFRVNVKTMSIYDNSDAVIQDNTTMSSIASNDWSDAVSQLNKAIDVMNTNVRCTQQIQQQYAEILGFYQNQKGRIDGLVDDVNNYISQQTSTVVNTTYLYTDYIAPSLNASSNNTIIFRTAATDGDSSYTEPIMIINEQGVIAPNIYNTNLYTTGVYVNDYTGNADDYDARNEALIGLANHDCNYNNAVLGDMFDTSTKMIIKLKYDTNYSIDNTTYHNKVYNQLYIEPSSPIFNSPNASNNIGYLKDASSGSLNYVGLIPFIVAQLQKISGMYTYEYQGKHINSINDIHSVADALEYLLSRSAAQFIQALIANLYFTGGHYRSINGSLISSGAIATISTAYYYAGEELTPTLGWNAADPNKASDDAANDSSTYRLGSVKFSYTTTNGTRSYDYPAYSATASDITQDNIKFFNPTINTSRQLQGVINYLTSNKVNGASYTYTLTVKSDFVDPQSNRRPADVTKTIYLRKMTKCYYWYSADEPGAQDFSLQTHINGVTLSNLGSFTTALLDSKAAIDIPWPNSMDHTERYIYFAIPQYDIENKLHCYVDYDFGAGSIEDVTIGGSKTLQEFPQAVAGYYIYKTTQRQESGVKIKKV